MTKNASPWVRTRGFGRLLAQETNISDLIQFLSDRDPTPWLDLVGFVPNEVDREARTANHADLLLTSSSRAAVVEVKLGHLMSSNQQAKYESLTSRPDLYLSALSLDEMRLGPDPGRWRFLSLSELVGRWENVDDERARVVAGEAAGVLREWDHMITRVFDLTTSKKSLPVSVLNQKFLARVVARRIAHNLQQRGRLATAGVTNGGGLPLIQSWTAIRGEGLDRTFMAEVRWWETKRGGELRFGVDFDPRPGRDEDEEVRRAAYDLARSMAADIEFKGLRGHFSDERPELANLLRRDKPSRPKGKGDWERVVVHGFKGAPLDGGRKNNRQRTAPDFYGDGALRFQAIADIDFGLASANDLTDLIDSTLTYLSSREPQDPHQEGGVSEAPSRI